MRHGAVTWLGKGVSSIAEQGITSLTGLVLQVALLRLLGLEQYGAFSIAFSVLMFAAGGTGALTFEPMAIVAGRIDRSDLRAYVAQAARLAALTAVGVSALAVAIVVALQPGGADLVLPLVAAALAFPFVAVHWAMRRGCYVLGSPGRGIVAAAVGAAVTLLLVWAGHAAGVLDPATAFAVLACAAICAAAVQCAVLAVRPASGGALPLRELLGRHWHYGRWILGASVAFWVMSGGLPLLATAFGGLEAAGAVRAFYNLILPLVQAVAALTAYATPVVARRHAEAGGGELRRYGRTMTSAFAAIGIVYCVILWAFGTEIAGLVYGDRTDGFLDLLPAFAAIGIVHCAFQSAGVVLTAAGRTDVIFRVQTVAAVLTVVAVAIAGHQFGVLGVAWAYAGGYLALGLGVGMAAMRLCRRAALAPTARA